MRFTGRSRISDSAIQSCPFFLPVRLIALPNTPHSDSTSPTRRTRLIGGFQYRNGKERPAWMNAYHSAQELSRSPGRKDLSKVRRQNCAKVDGEAVEQVQRICTVAGVDLRMNCIGECIVDNRQETHEVFATGTA